MSQDEFLNLVPGENNLRKIRTNRLLTQQQLSDLTKMDGEPGLSKVTISMLECNHHKPTDLTRMKLAKALQVDPGVLFPPITIQDKLKRRRKREIKTVEEMKREDGEEL